VYCSNDYNFDATLSLGECERIIDEFAGLGGAVLELSGGEPLLHPDIVSIIAHGKDKGLEVRLYTSGNFCRKGIYSAISDSMVRKLWPHPGLDKIFFNLEGGHVAHDNMTGIHNGYNNVVSGIKKTVARGIYTGVHFVPTKMNYKDIPFVVDECKRLGVAEVQILRFVPQGRGKYNRDTLQLAADENDKLYAILDAVERRKDIKVSVGHPFLYALDGHIEGGCPSGITTCLVKPTGDVVPCPAFKGNEKSVAGNVLMSSLADVWNGSPLLLKLRETRAASPRCY
jgi:MoaA/NifB/PqqE/SkfB family radical SAM enzyme